MCPGSAREVHSEAAAPHPPKSGSARRGPAKNFAEGCGETPWAGASFRAVRHATTRNAEAKGQGGRRERGGIGIFCSSVGITGLREKQALQALGLPHTRGVFTRGFARQQGKRCNRGKFRCQTRTGKLMRNHWSRFHRRFPEDQAAGDVASGCASCRRANLPITGISHSCLLNALIRQTK